MKKILTSAFIIATIALGAQNQKMKKACIKIEKEENGKVTKIDTCVTAATEAELQEKLNAIGFGEDLPPIPPTPPTVPTPPTPPTPPNAPEIEIVIDSAGGGKNFTCTKMIFIDDEEDGKSSKKVGTRKKMKVSASTGKDGETEVIVMDENGKVITHNKTKGGTAPEANVIVMDGDGKVITSEGGKEGNVVIKHLKPGEKMDPEIEKLMKENGFDYNYTTGDGGAQKIVIKNHENKNGKESKEVKVFVFSHMEVKELSDAEKKQLPADASKAIKNGKTFEGLTVAPNPTEDACKITYKSVSKEPLQIKVYNAEGKTVMTETENSVTDSVSKELSLKGLGQGVYFVHLTQGKQSEVRKVIVK